MKHLILAIFFLTAFQPTPDSILTVKLEKDGVIVGYVHFKEDKIVIQTKKRDWNIYMPAEIRGFDKASPDIAKGKDGKPYFNGDIVISEHAGWWATGWHYGNGSTGYKFTPTGFEPEKYEFHYED